MIKFKATIFAGGTLGKMGYGEAPLDRVPFFTFVSPWTGRKNTKIENQSLVGYLFWKILKNKQEILRKFWHFSPILGHFFQKMSTTQGQFFEPQWSIPIGRQGQYPRDIFSQKKSEQTYFRDDSISSGFKLFCCLYFCNRKTENLPCRLKTLQSKVFHSNFQ